MKKPIIALSVLALIMLVISSMSLSVKAHPGRTDGKGGHTNHSTGEYHYHHGYSPHDHYDMDGDGDIDCPYDFKDKTEKKPSYNTSPKENQKEVQKENPKEPIKENQKTRNGSTVLSGILKIALYIFCIYILPWIIFVKIFCQ